MITEAVNLIQTKKDNVKVVNSVQFDTPLDLGIEDKKGYDKPPHLLQLQDELINAWNTKQSLAVSMASRFGKTETMSYFISWLLMKYPSLKVMWVGYNHKTASRFVRNIKRILNRFSPEILDKDKQTQEYFETLEGGYVLATAPNSSTTSYGASIVVVDDLIKNDQEAMSKTVQENHWDFWDTTLSTRLEPFVLDGIQYDALVFAIGTLWTDQDLLNSFHNEFRSFKLPALNDDGESIWPQVWPTHKLLLKRQKMSSYFWQSMYMADPTIRGGNLFKEDWLKVYESPPPPDDIITSGLFVDPAISSNKNADNTAVLYAVLGNDRRLYFKELFLHHKSVFKNIEFLETLYHRLKPKMFYIEDVGFAAALVEGLQGLGVPAKGWTPGSRDKESRIVSQLEAPLETGMILFSQDIKDNKIFTNEYARFPKTAHDDSLDVMAIAAELLLNKNTRNCYTKSNQYYDFSSGAKKRGANRPRSMYSSSQ